MNRGPRPGSSSSVDYVAKATLAWGNPPDWIIALAEAASRDSAAAVAKRLGYSGSVISQALSASYLKGDIRRLEEIVRGALMGSTVMCPVLDEIGRDQCRREQSAPFRATNSTRARLRRACRTCLNREVKS